MKKILISLCIFLIVSAISVPLTWKYSKQKLMDQQITETIALSDLPQEQIQETTDNITHEDRQKVQDIVDENFTVELITNIATTYKSEGLYIIIFIVGFYWYIIAETKRRPTMKKFLISLCVFLIISAISIPLTWKYSKQKLTDQLITQTITLSNLPQEQIQQITDNIAPEDRQKVQDIVDENFTVELIIDVATTYKNEGQDAAVAKLENLLSEEDYETLYELYDKYVPAKQ